MKRYGIGGSDSPVILGVSPFRTAKELAEEKLGLIPQQEETPAMKRGTVLEPVAAQVYAELTGRKLQKKLQTLVHPQYDWMVAHIDRQVVGDSRGPGVLEIKCPGLKVFSECKRSGLPAYYVAQLMHYLAVTARKWGSFAVFSAERWEMIWFDIDRDEGLIKEIITNDEEFWNMLQAGHIPEDKEGPVIDLPPVGGQNLVKIETREWEQAITELREAQSLKKEAEAIEDDAKKKVQEIMITHQAVIAEGFSARVYWTIQNGRKTLDQKRLQKEHPEINLEQYMKIGTPFNVFKSYFIKERVNE